MATMELYATLPSSGAVGCALTDNYLYITNLTNLVRVDLNTGTVNSSWATSAQGYYGGYGIASDSQYVYSVSPSVTSRISIANPATNTVSWSTYSGFGLSQILCAYFYNGYIYFGSSVYIYRINISTAVCSLFYTHTNTSSVVCGIIHYNGFLYYGTGGGGAANAGIFKVSITTPTAGSAVLFSNTSPLTSTQVFGMAIKNDYMFIALENVNQFGQVSLINPSYSYNMNYSTTANLNMLCGIAIYGNYVYVCNYGSNILARVILPTVFPVQFAPLSASFVANMASSAVSIVSYNNFIYAYTGLNLTRINITTGAVTTNISNFAGAYVPYNLSIYGDNIYLIKNTTLYIYNITNNTTTTVSLGGTSTFGSCIVYPYLYFNTGSGIGRINITNTSDLTFSWSTAFANQYCIVGYNGFLYAGQGGNTPIYKANIASPATAATQFLTRADPINPGAIFGLEVYAGYLYVSNENYFVIHRYSFTDPTDYATPYAVSQTQNISGTNYNTIEYNCGLAINNGNIYITNYNNYVLSRVALPVYTVPMDTTIDAGNTYTVSSGNLQVSIIDPSNNTTNLITYWYATNINGTFVNTGLKPTGSATTATRFYISGLSSSVNTIYVIAKNDLGNSNVASASVKVFTMPSQVTSYSASFSLDTGLQVSITDTNNQIANNIYYYYYYFRTGDTAPNQSGNIAVYSNTYLPLTIDSTTNSFYIPNLMKGDYNIYVAAVNSYGANIYTPAIQKVSVICFKEDSRILTNKGYKKIQQLKKGDLVKTFRDGFKPIHRIGKKEIAHTPTEERSKNHLYKCSTTQYPELFEDLVLTGCHSLLVDDFFDEEQIRKTEETLGTANYMTDGKYRLPVCADHRASIYEKQGKYMVYHIALENDDYYMNYGIYANGLLVESTSKRFLDQFLIMET